MQGNRKRREIKPINRQIGQNVSAARKQRDFTQEELAEKIGLSSNQLSGIERGASGLTPETMMNLCNTLQVSADYLLYGGDSPNSNLRESYPELVDVDEKYIHQLSMLLHAVIEPLRRKDGE